MRRRNRIESSTTGYSAVNLGDTNNDDVGQIKYDNSTNSMQFTTNATEAIRFSTALAKLVLLMRRHITTLQATALH